ncbi:hypothetical protein [Streptomyces sp. ISL-100]|uniref:hypothetical protein n=1 Tax=Streptomyces sp. ISL-100 TaxID=2819173 RepID=UPI001BE74E96|nr:hypothetical protein [Streptomyces sp. ISL-100]MBT2400646.1 hypothetical protein [Streptomyces sp. ISL-100]
MPFRNPTTSLPADAITGRIDGTTQVLPGSITTPSLAAGCVTADVIHADAINGKIITGATIRTAPTFQKRIELTPSGLLRFYTGEPEQTFPGQISTGVTEDLPGWVTGYLTIKPPAHGNYPAPQLDLFLELDGSRRWVMGPLDVQVVKEGTQEIPFVNVAAQLNAAQGADVAGVLTAGNLVAGRTAITPSAANTPTSVTVTGLGLTGFTPRAVATPSTTLPGTQVTGVGTTSVTTSSFVLWLTRTNTTTTSIDWFVIAGEG